MSRASSPELARQWRDRLRRFEQSQLTVAEFCQLEGYRVTSFHKWRRRIAEVCHGRQSNAFVAIELSPHDLPSPSQGRSVLWSSVRLDDATMSKFGMFIPRNTQFGMLANIAALLIPLVALMQSRLVSSDVIGIDDTTVAYRTRVYRAKCGQHGFGSIEACTTSKIGRQNWLFVGSSRGGEVAATMYSLVSSAARHHLDIWAYVDDCLRQLAGGSVDYESLLPDN